MLSVTPVSQNFCVIGVLSSATKLQGSWVHANPSAMIRWEFLEGRPCLYVQSMCAFHLHVFVTIMDCQCWGGCCSTCKRVAGHSCILRVQTVVFAPGTFWTLLQSELIACATHLVQPHTAWTLAKMCLAPCPRHTTTKKREGTEEQKVWLAGILIQLKTDVLELGPDL